MREITMTAKCSQRVGYNQKKTQKNIEHQPLVVRILNIMVHRIHELRSSILDWGPNPEQNMIAVHPPFQRAKMWRNVTEKHGVFKLFSC
jgi:hypothetical protein